MRASHMLVDDPPPVFCDDFALGLSEFTPDEVVALASGFEPAIGAVFRATAIVRARFTDEQVDRAVGQGVDQYVILGAGLDSFAWRHPELTSKLEVFEVDHPGTQAYKRERLEAEALDAPESLHFVPVDFTAGTDVGTALDDAGFHSERRTIWSWLGVMVYLTHEQIRSTLQRLADLSAPGSTLVADFLLARDLMDDSAKAADDIGRPAAAEQGEPYVSTFDTDEVAALVTSSGWPLCRTWIPSDFTPWFTDRRDSMNPSTYVGLLVAQRS